MPINWYQLVPFSLKLGIEEDYGTLGSMTSGPPMIGKCVVTGLAIIKWQKGICMILNEVFFCRPPLTLQK